MDAPHPALPSVLEGLRALEKDAPLVEAALRAYYRQGWDGWPAPVGIPIGVAQDLLTQHGYRLGPVAHSLMASMLAVYTAWRLTKGAYLFDPLVWEELRDTPVHKLPVALLERLPEQAPLLLFPEPIQVADFQFDAAHVYFDYDPRPPAHLELRFLCWNRFEGGHQPINLILDLDGEDLEDCLRKTLERSPSLPDDPLAQQKRLNAEPPRQLYAPLISAALYLCQAEPDLSQAPRTPPAAPLSPRGFKRVRTPDKPHLIATGWRWGAAIRAAREARTHPTGEGSGRSVTPHVRRAHWHLYWVGEGSRKDRSKAQARLRWVPATLVGRDFLERELPATIRKVR